MAEEPKGFWATIPGVLTGIAAVITAVTGLYIAINGNGSSDDTDTSMSNEATEVATSSQVNEVSGNNGTQTVDSNLTDTSAKPLDLSVIIESETKLHEQLPDSGLVALVDCQQFPTVNSIETLMGWSNHYHQKIIDAGDVNKREVFSSCEKAIDYRGMAHCKTPNDMRVRQALFETLSLCRTAGIEWTDVKKK